MDALTPTLADTDTFEDHEQHTIWAVQSENQDGPQVYHILITIEKTRALYQVWSHHWKPH